MKIIHLSSSCYAKKKINNCLEIISSISPLKIFWFINATRVSWQRICLKMWMNWRATITTEISLYSSLWTLYLYRYSILPYFFWKLRFFKFVQSSWIWNWETRGRTEAFSFSIIVRLHSQIPHFPFLPRAFSLQTRGETSHFSISYFRMKSSQ